MPFGAELSHAIRISSKWVRTTTLSIWNPTKYFDIKDTKAAVGFQKPGDYACYQGKESMYRRVLLV